jgi:GntR family transcriptional regulator, transcriptional repressor for pyruvate dehydrogenase complex
MARFTAILKTDKHELVASALEKAIMDGELKVGEKLPSEQSLAGQFGVSRNIVREALRDVKARGLLEVRNGAGSFIARPTWTDLGDMLNRFLTLSDSAINDFYEIRFTLEIKACELAAERATEEDLARLEAIIREMERSLDAREVLTSLDFDFHYVIAAATKNPLFGSLLRPIKSIMTAMLNYSYSNPARDEALEGHHAIFDAMKKRDPKLAAAAMARHLENSEVNLTNLARRADEERRTDGEPGKAPAGRGGKRQADA